MAKKRTEPASSPKPSQRTLVSLKGNEQWAAWLRGLSDHVCLPATNVVDMALKEYAQRVEFPIPMPKRQNR
jgi:hypothetical protein